MAGNVTRAAVTHPSTNQARRCLTSVIWRELVTIRPCATKKLPQNYNSLINNIRVTSNDFLQHKPFHCSADFVWLDIIWTGKYMVKITYTHFCALWM